MSASGQPTRRGDGVIRGRSTSCGFGLVLICLATLVAWAPSALADGATGKNFSSELRAVEPPVDGLEVEVLDGDDALEIRNKTGRSFLIPGYDDEPYLRFKADGVVEENVRSPTKYVNVDRYALAPIPSIADSDASPRWKIISRDGTYEWHDHRIHWMSKETPPQVKDKTKRTRIMGWTIPVAFVNGDKARAAGTLFWDTGSHESDGSAAAESDGGSGISPAILVVPVLVAVALMLWAARRIRARRSPA